MGLTKFQKKEFDQVIPKISALKVSGSHKDSQNRPNPKLFSYEIYPGSN
jgi:hypothetical protein